MFHESIFYFQVFTINLLADKKYHHFRPVLDAYIETLFGAVQAHGYAKTPTLFNPEQIADHYNNRSRHEYSVNKRSILWIDT